MRIAFRPFQTTSLARAFGSNCWFCSLAGEKPRSYHNKADRTFRKSNRYTGDLVVKLLKLMKHIRGDSPPVRTVRGLAIHLWKEKWPCDFVVFFTNGNSIGVHRQSQDWEVTNAATTRHIYSRWASPSFWSQIQPTNRYIFDCHHSANSRKIEEINTDFKVVVVTITSEICNIWLRIDDIVNISASIFGELLHA